MAKEPRKKGTPEVLKGPPSDEPKRKRGRPPSKVFDPIPDTPENVIRAIVDVSPIDSRQDKRNAAC